jgi:hypothetical protein
MTVMTAMTVMTSAAVCSNAFKFLPTTCFAAWLACTSRGTSMYAHVACHHTGQRFREVGWTHAKVSPPSPNLACFRCPARFPVRSVSVSVSLCLPLSLCLTLSACLPVYLSVCLSLCLSVDVVVFLPLLSLTVVSCLSCLSHTDFWLPFRKLSCMCCPADSERVLLPAESEPMLCSCLLSLASLVFLVSRLLSLSLLPLLSLSLLPLLSLSPLLPLLSLSPLHLLFLSLLQLSSLVSRLSSLVSRLSALVSRL